MIQQFSHCLALFATLLLIPNLRCIFIDFDSEHIKSIFRFKMMTCVSVSGGKISYSTGKSNFFFACKHHPFKHIEAIKSA